MIDFEIERFAAVCASTVAVAVTGALKPSPVTVTVLTTLPPASGFAKALAEQRRHLEDAFNNLEITANPEINLEIANKQLENLLNKANVQKNDETNKIVIKPAERELKELLDK